MAIVNSLYKFENAFARRFLSEHSCELFVKLFARRNETETSSIYWKVYASVLQRNQYEWQIRQVEERTFSSRCLDQWLSSIASGNELAPASSPLSSLYYHPLQIRRRCIFYRDIFPRCPVRRTNGSLRISVEPRTTSWIIRYLSFIDRFRTERFSNFSPFRLQG